MSKYDTKYDWKLCFSDGGNGHSLWLDRNTNRYAIKDRSGRKPQFTDDGVLWVGNGSAIVQITRSELEVEFSVESERNGGSAGWCCYCIFDFGIRVAKELGMEIVLSEQLKKLKPLFCLTSSKGE